jgi:hypothetical protein
MDDNNLKLEEYSPVPLREGEFIKQTRAVFIKKTGAILYYYWPDAKGLEKLSV